MTLATRNAVNAHPIAPMPCNSRAAVGKAAATAIASKAISVIRIRMPALVRRYAGANTDVEVGAVRCRMSVCTTTSECNVKRRFRSSQPGGV